MKFFAVFRDHTRLTDMGLFRVGCSIVDADVGGIAELYTMPVLQRFEVSLRNNPNITRQGIDSLFQIVGCVSLARVTMHLEKQFHEYANTYLKVAAPSTLRWTIAE